MRRSFVLKMAVFSVLTVCCMGGQCTQTTAQSTLQTFLNVLVSSVAQEIVTTAP